MTGTGLHRGCFLGKSEYRGVETIIVLLCRSKGVAVFSRFDLLKAALASQLDPFNIGIVRYGHKDMVGQNLITFYSRSSATFIKSVS
jgi:hypothetical protein